MKRPVESDSGSDEEEQAATPARPFKNNDLYDAESSNDELPQPRQRFEN